MVRACDCMRLLSSAKEALGSTAARAAQGMRMHSVLCRHSKVLLCTRLHGAGNRTVHARHNVPYAVVVLCTRLHGAGN
eukprot:1161512-Pelagomonas_calceolata.AAC.20